MTELHASVAMTVYNGKKYLIQQLDSIRNQTVGIYEVLIIDDCSSDNTREIVQSYIDMYELSGWRLIVNESNLGWKKNFHKAISQTCGDIVYFSDQDDVWDIKKIETMNDIFNRRPNIDVLACRCSYIDSNSKPITIKKGEIPFGCIKGNGNIVKEGFNKKYIYAIMPGCTMGVRRHFIDEISCASYERLPHDALYWKIGILKGTAYYVDLPLIKYRIHDSNASSPLTVKHVVKNSSKRSNENQNYKADIIAAKDIYKQLGGKNMSIFRGLSKIIKFCDWRNDLINRNHAITTILRFPLWVSYYRSYRMLAGDCLAMFKK